VNARIVEPTVKAVPREQLCKTPIARHGFSSLPTPVQQLLSQQQIQRTGLSAQVPISTNNDVLKFAIFVQHIIAELSDAVTEKGNIIVIKKWHLT
jgi:hypothetical protein